LLSTLTVPAICFLRTSGKRTGLKHGSRIVLPFLLVVVFVFALVPSFSFATRSSTSSYEATDQPLLVWFDSPPQLTILYPTFLEFNVAAETSPGLWITWLHWDFGDGSTLDVPFSAQSYVSDVRYHQYTQPGTYTVAVTAYDNMGNSNTAQITVSWTDGPQSDSSGYGVQVSSATGLTADYQGPPPICTSPDFTSAVTLTGHSPQ
jgi:PKD repeat protein